MTEFHDALPDFFRQVAHAGGLLPYGQDWLDGKLQPWYDTSETTRRTTYKGLTVVEKLIANRAWIGGSPADEDGPQFGLAEVQPGDQVLCQVAFRGMHEYTAGMCMALYREAFGQEPVELPEQVAVFEDHFVLIDEPTVPASVKRSLAPARKLAQEMVDACEEYGLRRMGQVANMMRECVIASW